MKRVRVTDNYIFPDNINVLYLSYRFSRNIAMKDYTLEYKLVVYSNYTPSSSISLHIYPDSKYFAYKHPTSNYKEKF